MTPSPEEALSESRSSTGFLSRSSETALWVIIASATLTVMAGAILSPVVNQIQAGLNVSQSLAGLIITTHGLFIVLTSPIAGALIDRIGPRRPYIVGLILYALAGGAGLVIESFPVLLASRVVLGVAVAFVYTSITVLIYNLFEGARKDKVMGLRGSANSLGGVVWPLAGGVLGTLSWHLPFGVYLLAFPLGLVALVSVPDTAVTSRQDATESEGGIRGLVSVFLETPLLVFVYGLYFASNLLLYAIVVYYPQLLAGVGVGSSFVIGLYIAGLGVAAAVSAYFYDRIKQRFDYQQVVLGVLFPWAVGFGLATVASSRLLATLPVVLFGLGHGLVIPTVFLWVEELVPSNQKGQFSSYVAMFGYLGQFLAPILFGLVAKPFGVRTAFATAAVVAGLGLVVSGGRYTVR